MDERPPVRPVAVHRQRAVRQPAEDEVVHHEVEPDARRPAVVRAHPERGRVEVVRRDRLVEQALAGHLRLGVRVERVLLGRLVDVAARRAAVVVTRGGDDDAVDVELARGREHVLGAVAVHRERLLAPVVRRRGAGDRREVDHGVDAAGRALDGAVLAHVAPAKVEPVADAAGEVRGRTRRQRVEDDDLAHARVVEQARDERAADVAAAAGDEDALTVALRCNRVAARVTHRSARPGGTGPRGPRSDRAPRRASRARRESPTRAPGAGRRPDRGTARFPSPSCVPRPRCGDSRSV